MVVVGLSIAVNSYGRTAGWPPVDLPPFHYLKGLISAQALLLTIAVLIRRNRMAQMAEHRARLDLPSWAPLRLRTHRPSMHAIKETTEVR